MAEGHRSLTLTAAEVADAPLLGYRLIHTGEINPALADRAVLRRLTQPWVIRRGADDVLLDVALVGALSPLSEMFNWHSVRPHPSAPEGDPAGSPGTFRGTCRLNPDDVVLRQLPEPPPGGPTRPGRQVQGVGPSLKAGSAHGAESLRPGPSATMLRNGSAVVP
ncbi:MAG: hypothetical protein R2754_01730 [Microthrixaceae bacterium]